MTKLQQVNKIVIKMLNKHKNQRMESRNVAIDRKITRLLENSVEATSIVQNLCCYLLKMLYEKNIRNNKTDIKKRKKNELEKKEK